MNCCCEFCSIVSMVLLKIAKIVQGGMVGQILAFQGNKLEANFQQNGYVDEVTHHSYVKQLQQTVCYGF